MDLQVGDELRVVSPLGVLHSGVYVGPRGPNDEDIGHNTKWGEVELVTLEEFAGGRPVQVIESPARTWWEAERIADRARSLLGRRYDLLRFNCEHVTNFAVKGEATSPTVSAVVTAAAVVAVCMIAARG